MNMIYETAMRRFGPLVLALICLLLFTAGTSFGATRDYYLRVDAFKVPGTTLAPGVFGNTAPVMVWGFANCGTDATFTTCTDAVPGPVLSATEGDTLNIHVKNNLGASSPAGAYVEPTSVIIPGQPGGNMTPTWTDGTTGNRTGLSQRVRSFTAETAVGATRTYTWPSVKAGTYLYQSGTHPAVQVQMGLYGALRVYAVAPVSPATSGQAYDDASTVFNNEVTLLFSEMDPLLHNAVECNYYGPSPTPVLQATNPDCPAVAPSPMTSTVDYNPKYFLINGKAFAPANPPLTGGAVNQKLLIRFLNAGLAAHVPVVQGPYMSIIAEDGNFLSATTMAGTVVTAPKLQYSVLLQAGKTMDAIFIPTVVGNVAVYDRRLNLTNAGTAPGGMFTYLGVTASGAAPLSSPRPRLR